MEELFNRFYKKIKLTSTQRKDAKVKYTGVCKKLHDHYYPDTAYNGSTKLLIGSYGKHTNIRPPRDVDVIFKLPESIFANYSDNTSNPQSQLLQDVREIISEKYTTTEKISAWGKVVLIKFTDSKHNIEVLPAWENEDRSFRIPNSENGGSWDNWNPRSELENLNSFEEDNGMTRKFIRIIKKWAENCTVNLKTYEIESAILDFMFQKLHENKDLTVAIRDFFNFYNLKLSDEQTKSHLATAYNRASKACVYENEPDYVKASSEWKKVFGDDFPAFVDKKMFNANLVRMQKMYPSTGEEFLNTNYGINIAIKPEYKVKVDARVEQDGYRPNWLSRISFLKKKKKLIFKIIENNVPNPYEVMWKVRNFGDEAMNANDLRGEISKDQGENMKIENTKYLGEHYVECYIIQNNQCVAFDRTHVPIGSNF